MCVEEKARESPPNLLEGSYDKEGQAKVWTGRQGKGRERDNDRKTESLKSPAACLLRALSLFVFHSPSLFFWKPLKNGFFVL